MDGETGDPGLFSLAFWAAEWNLAWAGRHSLLCKHWEWLLPTSLHKSTHLPMTFSSLITQLCFQGQPCYVVKECQVCPQHYSSNEVVEMYSRRALFYSSTETRCRQGQGLARKSSGTWTAQVGILAPPFNSWAVGVSEFLQFACLKIGIIAPTQYVVKKAQSTWNYTWHRVGAQ